MMWLHRQRRPNPLLQARPMLRIPSAPLTNNGEALVSDEDIAEMVRRCRPMNPNYAYFQMPEWERVKVRAACRGLRFDTAQNEQDRLERLPTVWDPTKDDRPDPGGWLRTPENDAPRKP